MMQRKHKQKRSRRPPEKNKPLYKRVWKVVDGAVCDAFIKHPDYLSTKGKDTARLSITKRVCGAVTSFIEQMKAEK